LLNGYYRLATEASRPGNAGERAAFRFLVSNGYKPLVRNYRSRWGELDLICRDKGTLVFVEVKSRDREAWGRPADAVDLTKQRRLIRTAQAYLQELEEDEMPLRFDVVEVELEEGRPQGCRLIRRAFELRRGRNS